MSRSGLGILGSEQVSGFRAGVWRVSPGTKLVDEPTGPRRWSVSEREEVLENHTGNETRV